MRFVAIDESNVFTLFVPGLSSVTCVVTSAAIFFNWSGCFVASSILLPHGRVGEQHEHEHDGSAQ